MGVPADVQKEQHGVAGLGVDQAFDLGTLEAAANIVEELVAEPDAKQDAAEVATYEEVVEDAYEEVVVVVVETVAAKSQMAAALA